MKHVRVNIQRGNRKIVRLTSGKVGRSPTPAEAAIDLKMDDRTKPPIGIVQGKQIRDALE